MHKKVVTIGGGTGSFMVLSELKKRENIEITAIVNMTDAGGSTGQLRDEIGVLPAGDARQALIALAQSEQQWRDLMTYRFEDGNMSGHSFGNLLLGALEKISGSFEQALERASELLQVRGTVVPITLDDSQVIIESQNDEIFYGENKIDESVVANPKAIYFNKSTTLNPVAEQAIKKADIIIICPGNFYCSIMPNLLVSGMHQALSKSRAKKYFIANLVSKYGHTTDMTVFDFIDRAHKAVDLSFIDTVIYNTQTTIDPQLQAIYDADGEHLISVGDMDSYRDIEQIGVDLIAEDTIAQNKHDTVKRSLIRHDAKKLVDIILK